MRRCYLVCYDIRDPKRLRRTHKLVKAYGEAWQYSVFYCTLKAIDRGWRTPSAKRSISRWTSS
jgi:CRISPR-associated protein Cas2